MIVVKGFQFSEHNNFHNPKEGLVRSSTTRKTFPEGQGFDFLLIKCFPGCDLKIVLLSVTAEGQKLAGSESRKELFNFKVTRYVSCFYLCKYYTLFKFFYEFGWFFKMRIKF